MHCLAATQELQYSNLPTGFDVATLSTLEKRNVYVVDDMRHQTQNRPTVPNDLLCRNGWTPGS